MHRAYHPLKSESLEIGPERQYFLDTPGWFEREGKAKAEDRYSTILL